MFGAKNVGEDESLLFTHTIWAVNSAEIVAS